MHTVRNGQERVPVRCTEIASKTRKPKGAGANSTEHRKEITQWKL